MRVAQFVDDVGADLGDLAGTFRAERGDCGPTDISCAVQARLNLAGYSSDE
jgi:hypothetical protein